MAEEYNEFDPNLSLENMTPNDFVRTYLDHLTSQIFMQSIGTDQGKTSTGCGLVNAAQMRLNWF